MPDIRTLINFVFIRTLLSLSLVFLWDARASLTIYCSENWASLVVEGKSNGSSASWMYVIEKAEEKN